MTRKCSLSDFIWGESEEGSRFLICPVGSKRAFELRLPCEEDVEAWVSSLLKHIQGAGSRRSGAVPSPMPLDLSTGWWKISRISPEQFVDIADTGDVLLFRSHGFIPRLIRAASGCGRYDHVALVLKIGDGTQLALMEASGNTGVKLCLWSRFIANDWQEIYPEMALRRVHFDRTDERLDALEEWCHQVIGKPYGLTMNKLFLRTEDPKGTTDADFFCSQLVADGLKVLGVLPKAKMSTTYWPAHFSVYGGALETMPGCRFSSEDLIIDFTLGEAKARKENAIAEMEQSLS